MFRFAVVASLVAASSISPALAKESEKTAAANPDDSKIVCRREVPTGSVMAKKVCRTRAQWTAIAQQAQEGLRRGQDLDRAQSHTGMSLGNN